MFYLFPTFFYLLTTNDISKKVVQNDHVTNSIWLKLTVVLKILIGKKHPQIEFQRLRKVWIRTYGSLVYQINSLEEVLKLKQNFQKNKVVTGKTPFFVIGPFSTHHSSCLGNHVFSILILATKKQYSSFLRNIFVFLKICFKFKALKTFKISTDCHVKQADL